MRALIATLAVLLLVAPAALAKGGDDDRSGKGGGRDDDRQEARVRGTCGKGATSELRLRSRDGSIALEFRLDSRKRGERWRVTIVQERRVEWRGTVRTTGSSGNLKVRRSLSDQEGADAISVRATGPRGCVCTTRATLPG